MWIVVRIRLWSDICGTWLHIHTLPWHLLTYQWTPYSTLWCIRYTIVVYYVDTPCLMKLTCVVLHSLRGVLRHTYGVCDMGGILEIPNPLRSSIRSAITWIPYVRYMLRHYRSPYAQYLKTLAIRFSGILLQKSDSWHQYGVYDKISNVF